MLTTNNQRMNQRIFLIGLEGLIKRQWQLQVTFFILIPILPKHPMIPCFSCIVSYNFYVFLLHFDSSSSSFHIWFTWTNCVVNTNSNSFDSLFLSDSFHLFLFWWKWWRWRKIEEREERENERINRWMEVMNTNVRIKFQIV